jgi:hypothetical protein
MIKGQRFGDNGSKRGTLWDDEVMSIRFEPYALKKNMFWNLYMVGTSLAWKEMKHIKKIGKP